MSEHANIELTDFAVTFSIHCNYFLFPILSFLSHVWLRLHIRRFSFTRPFDTNIVICVYEYNAIIISLL